MKEKRRLLAMLAVRGKYFVFKASKDILRVVVWRSKTQPTMIVLEGCLPSSLLYSHGCQKSTTYSSRAGDVNHTDFRTFKGVIR